MKNKKQNIALVVLGILIALAIVFATVDVGRIPITALDCLGGLFGRPCEEAADMIEQNSLFSPALSYEQAVTSAVESAAPAVVSVAVSKEVPIIEDCAVESLPGSPFMFYRPCQVGTELQEVGNGSGFIVSADGLVVTNRHVVVDEGAQYSVFTNAGEEFSATVVARDPVLDLAILDIDATDLPVLQLSDSEDIKLGQTAIAIGNALGEFRNTVSVGVISGLSRDIVAAGSVGSERIEGVLQTDAAINRGNSGGPLLNLQGKVVGINTAVAQGAQNIGFAIPANQAKHIIESVQTYGELRVAYLGVRYMDVTPALAEAHDLPVKRGAWLREPANASAVAPDSPAESAGLQNGDIIVQVNEFKVGIDGHLATVLRRFSPGDAVDIVVLRSGEQITLSATLGEFPLEE